MKELRRLPLPGRIGAAARQTTAGRGTRVVTAVAASALLVTAWGFAAVLVARQIWSVRSPSGIGETGIAVMLSVIVGFVLVGGARSSSFVVAYPLARALESRVERRVMERSTASSARVALLVCTADDFVPEALEKTMRQTHPLVDTYVLDDSRSAETQREVDAVAARLGAHVVRREHRTGFKAGNLNHFLSSGLRSDHDHVHVHDHVHDHVVVVDSDQALRPDFVEKALRRMEAEPGIGIVQGRQLVHPGVTSFARRFGGMLQSYVLVSQTVRSAFGFSMFMGRGALISVACLEKVGGLPEVVMEDVSFSIEAREAGFRIVWAPEVLSSEDFPVDYSAFRKQQGKFAQGSVEFVKNYGGALLASRLTIREKLDVILDSLATPVSTGLAFVVFIASLLPVGPHGWGFLPQQVGLLLGACGLAPLVPEVLRKLKAGQVLGAASFVVQASALYASTLWLTMSSMARVVVGGRARFLITPKVRGHASFWDLRGELCVAAVAVGVDLLLSPGVGASMVFVVALGAAAWMHLLDRRRA